MPIRPSPVLDAGFACPRQMVEKTASWVDSAEVAYDAN